MKSIDTRYEPASSNPVLVNKYLVYGEGRPDPSGTGFQAWYWIDIPGQPPIRVRSAARFGSELYSSEGCAAAVAVTYGQAIARTLPRA